MNKLNYKGKPDKVERIKDLTDEQQEIQDQINEAKKTRSLLTRRIKNKLMKRKGNLTKEGFLNNRKYKTK